MTENDTIEMCDRCLSLQPIGELRVVTRPHAEDADTEGDGEQLMVCVDIAACEQRQRE